MHHQNQLFHSPQYLLSLPIIWDLSLYHLAESLMVFLRVLWLLNLPDLLNSLLQPLEFEFYWLLHELSWCLYNFTKCFFLWRFLFWLLKIQRCILIWYTLRRLCISPREVWMISPTPIVCVEMMIIALPLVFPHIIHIINWFRKWNLHVAV